MDKQITDRPTDRQKHWEKFCSITSKSLIKKDKIKLTYKIDSATFIWRSKMLIDLPLEECNDQYSQWNKDIDMKYFIAVTKPKLLKMLLFWIYLTSSLRSNLLKQPPNFQQKFWKNVGNQQRMALCKVATSCHCFREHEMLLTKQVFWANGLFRTSQILQFELKCLTRQNNFEFLYSIFLH